MYEIRSTGKFKKDIKRILKRKYEIQLLKEVIDTLETHGELPQEYKTHQLQGNYKGYFECHIKPDWLLIWKQDSEAFEISLIRTGSHADLFG
ncbi:MAG: type II toxin-antitoxin system YafQ family toxin [Bacteroidales bacterium]|nr:type II toxin-antitoxin system YafQ family toxin [Bacteroidales bacterium]